MYYYGNSYHGHTIVWLTISLVLGIVGGICLYVCFVRENRKLTDPRLIKLRDFLQFRTTIMEPVLKALYCILALFITLYSFALISESFVGFLLFLIFGNVVTRLCYEGSMIILMIWRNTADINKKLDKCECKEDACKCHEEPKAEEVRCSCEVPKAEPKCFCEKPIEPKVEEETLAEKAEETEVEKPEVKESTKTEEPKKRGRKKKVAE